MVKSIQNSEAGKGKAGKGKAGKGKAGKGKAAKEESTAPVEDIRYYMPWIQKKFDYKPGYKKPIPQTRQTELPVYFPIERK